LKNRSFLWAGLVTVLAGIVAVLAVLQYRWSGEVSRAERETLSENLNLTVRQFRQEFYHTLLDVAVAFPSNPTLSREQELKDWVDSGQRWFRTTSHPELITGVYTWTADGQDTSQLLRLDPEKMQFEPADWPQELVELRHRLDGNPAVMPHRGNGSPSAAGWMLEEQVRGWSFRFLLRPEKQWQRVPPVGAPMRISLSL
jgi:hypothetical protein